MQRYLVNQLGAIPSAGRRLGTAGSDRAGTVRRCSRSFRKTVSRCGPLELWQHEDFLAHMNRARAAGR
jgi:hypothetical protein